ncbi:unnamed protein product [Prunus armeniaca]|uniref:Uncharacterized protein n=1 Tax=Prunus armeniaca TaxID=36596 RepID=A0A6J5UCE9_PRUAR|nr:unnamed protein product [Prunus armeniaca]
MPLNSPTQSTPPKWCHMTTSGGWWPKMVFNGWQRRMVMVTGVSGGKGCWRVVATGVGCGWGVYTSAKK